MNQQRQEAKVRLLQEFIPTMDDTEALKQLKQANWNVDLAASNYMDTQTKAKEEEERKEREKEREKKEKERQKEAETKQKEKNNAPAEYKPPKETEYYDVLEVLPTASASEIKKVIFFF